jgi:hypothetical protein
MSTPLPPNDHKISLDEAIKLTTTFRAQGFKGSMPVIAFRREGFERILKQDGCVGIRSYPAVKADGTATIVMVGVDGKGNDMVDGELSQDGYLCPQFCPDVDALNSGG